MDGQDIQDSDPAFILCILSIHVEYSFFPPSSYALRGNEGRRIQNSGPDRILFILRIHAK